VTSRRRLVIEAAFSLAAARLLLRLVPFRRLVWFFHLKPAGPEPPPAARARLLADVPRAIAAATRLLPGESVCFPVAIAALAMLRRRGVGTTLYCGAGRSTERKLHLHVWLRYGDHGVVGHENADEFQIIARYPEPRL